MKRLLHILLIILTVATTASARTTKRSVLEIKLSDGSQLIVAIDGRNFNKHGRTITIGDLPKGWHDLKVYKYLEYKEGGARAKTIYTGRIRVDAGTLTSCLIDVQTQRMRIKTMDLDETMPANDAQNNNNATAHNSNHQDQLSNQDLKDLQAGVEGLETDIERLKLMKSELDKKVYYSIQVRTMLGWLAFEGSKLDFAKWSYERVLDKQDYSKLEDVFMLSDSKDEFNSFISPK